MVSPSAKVWCEAGWAPLRDRQRIAASSAHLGGRQCVVTVYAGECADELETVRADALCHFRGSGAPRRGRRHVDRRPGERQPHRPRLGRLRRRGLLDRLQERQPRRRRDLRDRRVRRRHLGQDDGWQPGRRLPPLHRLAAVLRRRRAGRGDRHLPPDELGQGAGAVQGAGSVRRQAVLHPLRLGLQLDPLPDRSGAGGGRVVERDVRSEVLRAHLDVG